MKQVVKMARLVDMLEKAFNLINADWFEGKLELPIITIIPSPRAYAHYTTVNVWKPANKGKGEMNIASGMLDKPLEEVVASLMHEMVHMWNDSVLNTQDTSRGGQWHNRFFAIEAEKHGLTVWKSPKSGYAFTACDDELLEWITTHDEIRQIGLLRSDIWHTVSAPADTRNRKYSCPQCGASIQAPKYVHLLCADCMELMREA